MNSRPLIAAAMVCSGLLSVLPSTTVHAQDKAQWPLVFTANGEEVQVFTPQPETYDGARFSMRAAVSLKRSPDAEPIFGAIWGNGMLEVDRDSRMGVITRFTVTDARMPGLESAALGRFKEMLSTEIPKRTAPLAIDWIVSALENEQQHDDAYVNDPPAIIYREQPSVLVFLDGEPVYEDVKVVVDRSDPVYSGGGSGLERVVNTPFFIVRPKGGAHYLYGSGLWYSARDVKGPWAQETRVPTEVKDLAKQVDDSAELVPTGADDGAIIPEVVVSTVPAELLDLKGAPQFQPLPETGLLYATNTNDDLFMDITTQDYYFLTSGRWYATRDLKNGPWRYVASDRLPAAFAQIPEGSAKDGALAHIAGTKAATEAVRDASIPQTATVDRKSATVNVTYTGDPQFERIANTNVYRAINASTTVLRINDRYHVVDNAVWFEGDTPDGPWAVSTVVPAEVNEIPPSSEVYNVRYVYIYDYTPNVVFTGYTPGYLGCYVQGGSVIYGTGYYYPWGGFWRPRPFTWGFNMYYDPWVGWGYGMGWGFNWYYPAWGGYGFYGRPYGCGWWGPWGYYPPVFYDHGHGHYYGHRPSMSGSRTTTAGVRQAPLTRERSANLYTDRAEAGVLSTVVDRSTARANATMQQPQGTTAPTTKPGDVTAVRDHFTDAAGNVYRREGDGPQRYENGRWTKVPPAERETTAPQTRPQEPVQREPTTRPQTSTERPAAQPNVQQRPARDPQRIQQDRERGEQRVNDMDRYRQQRTQPPATRPAPTPQLPRAPQRVQPPARSSPSPAPSTSPSRGGGGGGRKR